MGSHLIDGEFQSDKYPTTPRGKVPLSVKDPSTQDLLWEYAQRRRSKDAEFSEDLETALRAAGFDPSSHTTSDPRVGWFVSFISRIDHTEKLLAPLRRKAAGGDSLSVVERRAFMKLLEQHEELVAEQAARLADTMLSSLAKTQTALLKRLARQTKVAPAKRKAKGT